MARNVAESLFMDICLDLPPSSIAARVDFGIDSDRHMNALYRAVKNAEIDADGLDAMLGKGPELTKFCRAHQQDKDIVFKTAWDDLGEEEPDEELDPLKCRSCGIALPMTMGCVVDICDNCKKWNS